MARIRGYVGKLPEPRSLPDAVDLLKETMSERFNGLSEADWEDYARITSPMRWDAFASDTIAI